MRTIFWCQVSFSLWSQVGFSSVVVCRKECFPLLLARGRKALALFSFPLCLLICLQSFTFFWVNKVCLPASQPASQSVSLNLMYIIMLATISYGHHGILFLGVVWSLSSSIVMALSCGKISRIYLIPSLVTGAATYNLYQFVATCVFVFFYVLCPTEMWATCLFRGVSSCKSFGRQTSQNWFLHSLQTEGYMKVIGWEFSVLFIRGQLFFLMKSVIESVKE